ncbi:MAG: UDP-N-acetylmuramate:L-alanyl-gamma-D-glutamyl-meso-diaminopimelate ligase [Kangiella sp.]|nr:MAG: UDP-N-acetylmuramate:L-alanyl-gamma-D-glutamyl-meso-diaminopimelate ligase [Kangiella sp.]
MHLHILGICGTFMGGIARLAIEKGFKVTGSDKNSYPPMSDQLENMGITLVDDEDNRLLGDNPDCVIVGNALSRGNVIIESMLNTNQVFTSGPQWLKENVLHDKWVIAVAGTHGKTTTASMIVWILESLGYNPGFLVGGVMENFGVSARLTDSPFFVVEADEYDTAFFDKRSKFVHYRARTCVLNNLEFDHADIFDDLSAIENQFHHLVRCIPSNGLIIKPFATEAIDRVISRGCWTPIETFDLAIDNSTSPHEKMVAEGQSVQADWKVKKDKDDASDCQIYFKSEYIGQLTWNLIGNHNINNAMAALAAVRHVGVKPIDAIEALAKFENVKRRMELKGFENGISVYDDFAHHPTAIESTLIGLRHKVGKARIIAIVDPRSNTMRMGCHKNRLKKSIVYADITIFHIPESYCWELEIENNEPIMIMDSVKGILAFLENELKSDDHVLIMSNGSFDGIHERLLDQIKQKKINSETNILRDGAKRNDKK